MCKIRSAFARLAVFVALWAVSVTGSTSRAIAKDATASPNFVIFYVDDLGWADTSVRMVNGEPLSQNDFYQTPALEQLAMQGMRFSNGYAPTPTCTGSRISILFGKTPARLQYRNVFDVLAKKQRPHGWDDEISMAGVLKAANKGYVRLISARGQESVEWTTPDTTSRTNLTRVQMGMVMARTSTSSERSRFRTITQSGSSI